MHAWMYRIWTHLQELCATQEMDTFWFAALAESKIGTIYTDLPGHFPVHSIWNMQYIFIWYLYQSNAILFRPMKTISGACMVESYQDIYKYLTARGLSSTPNFTDNECFKAVQNYTKSQNFDLATGGSRQPSCQRCQASHPNVQK